MRKRADVGVTGATGPTWVLDSPGSLGEPAKTEGPKPGAESGLAPRLRAARESATRLHEATDRLNEVLTAAETAFSDLGLGVQAAIEMSGDSQWPGTLARHLAFRKHEGRWSLLIDEEIGGDCSTTHVLKASRALRIEAASLVPALLERVIEKTSEQASEVDAEVQKLSRFVTELRGGSS